jgi:hypothetical protein
MKTKHTNPTDDTGIITPGQGGINRLAAFQFGPRILFDKDNEGGNEGGDEAAKAAADKAAADKAAADKAAADKAAADKAAAEAAKAEELKEKLKGMTDSEAKLLKEQMATKEKLKAEREAREALEAKLKAFEGLDPAKVKELVEANAKAEEKRKQEEEKRLVQAGEFDRLKAMMADSFKTEKTAIEGKLTETSTALDAAMKTINELTVGSAFNSSSFIGEETVLTPRIARDAYGPHFEIENGVPIAYDKPKGADKRTKLVGSDGEPLGFEDAIKKLVESAPDKDQILKSKLKQGARSTTVEIRPTARTSHQQQTEDGPRGVSRITAALNKGALKKTK